MQITKSLTPLFLATLGGTVFGLISVDIAQAVTFTFNGREDIILGLHPPYKGKYSDYGVA